MKSLKGNLFPARHALSDSRDRCRVQAGIEVARMHSDHLLAAIAEALTRLPVDVENGLVLVEQEETVRRVIDEAAKALLALPQFVLRPLALGDIAHHAQVAVSALLKMADPNLDRKGCAVLAPVAALERDRFPGDASLLQALDGCLVQTDVEITSMFADQFFPAVAQTFAGLAVDVENGRTIVKQKKGVSRGIEQCAEALFARADL